MAKQSTSEIIKQAANQIRFSLTRHVQLSRDEIDQGWKNNAKLTIDNLLW